jgi:hypothetical protein
MKEFRWFCNQFQGTKVVQHFQRLSHQFLAFWWLNKFIEINQLHNSNSFSVLLTKKVTPAEDCSFWKEIFWFLLIIRLSFRKLHCFFPCASRAFPNISFSKFKFNCHDTLISVNWIPSRHIQTSPIFHSRTKGHKIFVIGLYLFFPLFFESKNIFYV